MKSKTFFQRNKKYTQENGKRKETKLFFRDLVPRRRRRAPRHAVLSRPGRDAKTRRVLSHRSAPRERNTKLCRRGRALPRERRRRGARALVPERRCLAGCCCADRGTRCSRPRRSTRSTRPSRRSATPRQSPALEHVFYGARARLTWEMTYGSRGAGAVSHFFVCFFGNRRLAPYYLDEEDSRQRPTTGLWFLREFRWVFESVS